VLAGHLVEGTQKQNIQDAVRKGRMALGERNGSSKLKVEQVREIRSRYVVGDITQTTLAEEYGVSQPVISQIVRGEKWERVV
jgi:hypothetical protein